MEAAYMWLQRAVKENKSKTTIAAATTIALIFHNYLRRALRREPGPWGLPCVGVLNCFVTQSDQMHKIMASWTARYGDYFVVDAVRVVSVFSNPSDINAIYKDTSTFPQRDDGLGAFGYFMPSSLLALNTNDVRWKHHRSVFTCLFSGKYMDAYKHSMVQVATEIRTLWASQGGTADVAVDMNMLALDTLGLSLLGTRVAEFLTKEDVTKYTTLMDALDGTPTFVRPFVSMPFWKEGHAIDRKLSETARGLIAKARAGELSPHSLVSVAVEQCWPDEDILSEVKGFLLAGFETSSNTLTFFMCLLAHNPEVQEKVRQEIQCCVKDNNFAALDISKLVYTWAAFRESLRLFPTVAINARYCTCDANIGGHFVPKGRLVLLATSVAARDFNYFPDPHKFDPTRWLESSGKKKARHDPYGIIKNFGGGVRQCIGMRFAEQEVLVAIAVLLHDHKVSVATMDSATTQPSSTPPIDTVLSMTLSPAVPIPMSFTHV